MVSEVVVLLVVVVVDVEEVVIGVVVRSKLGATGLKRLAVRPWRCEADGEAANGKTLAVGELGVVAVAIVAIGVEVRR